MIILKFFSIFQSTVQKRVTLHPNTHLKFSPTMKIHTEELEDYSQISKGEIGERKKMKMSRSTSHHSIIGFEIRFARSFSKYLWTYFLPSFLAVFIAGCSFIIPPSSVPGRMMLLVTLFLVQMELLQSLQVIIGI